MFNKLSAAQVQQVLLDAASSLRSLADENEALREKVAAAERHTHAEKIAHAMHERGVDTDTPTNELIDRLEKLAQTDPNEYRALERAVDMIGTDMSVKQAHLDYDKPTGRGLSAFEQAIIG